MIDVWAVAANGLWVLGLSLVLAALSYGRWERAASRRSPARSAGDERQDVQPGRGRASATWADLGVLLFCAGLAATSDRWWERVVWSVLALAWAIRAALRIRQCSHQCREGP